MLALLLAVAALQDAASARAESLLAAGDTRAALAIARRLADRHPRDPAAHLLLGRVQYARPVIGRYPALEAFRTAARLAPRDPAPLYWQVKVGFYLGSDEGEVIAREAILRILALDPDYEDVWARFETLYHNRDIWRRAERALAHHPAHVVALERRAAIAVALEDPQRADSLAAEVLRRRGAHVPAYLLRAEASFNAGRDAAGYAWYDSALAYADADSAGAMWDAVWMIATPDEVRAQDSTPPGERRRFFERFWTARDPNVLTPGNERIAEHFRRFAHARRYFRLLHPLNLYHRSPGYRAILTQAQRDYLQQRAEASEEPYPGFESDRLLAGARQLPDVPAGNATSASLAGLDARGLIYVRLGAPDQLLRGFLDPLHPVLQDNPLDVEGWLYHTPQGTLTIGFRRGSGSTIASLAGGDFVFLPSTRRQAVSTRAALQMDRSTLPAPLAVRAWTAFFKSAVHGLTDAYYVAQAESAAVMLWDGATAPVRARGDGLLRVSMPPGRYALGLDVQTAGVLGRSRRDVVLPAFSLGDLGISSLALAPGPELLDREATLAAMPADLVYPAGRPLAAYAEIYGLGAAGDGRARYRVRYSFAPLRSVVARLVSSARPVVFEFEREVDAGGTTPERLVIQPDELPRGRYRVTLAVTDLQRNVKSESVAIDVTIR